VPAIAAFGNYVTTGDLNSRFATANVLWVSKSGNDSTGARGRFDLPYLTVGAAQTDAQSGDVIRVLQGDYSSESINGKDGVFYDFMEGSIGPKINLLTAITIRGRGLCEFISVDGLVTGAALIDAPELNSATQINCTSSASTIIAGIAGASSASSGTLRVKEVKGALSITGGSATIAGNVGDNITITGGTLRLLNCQQVTAGSLSNRPLRISGAANVITNNGRHEMTRQNSVAIELVADWSGKLIAKNCTFVATNAGTDGATKGINYGTGVTGEVQLINCSIITAQNGSGTAKSIDAPSAQDVIIQGSLNQTHDKDSDITFVGGSAITNTNFDG
jgi:hypothetical protein